MASTKEKKHKHKERRTTIEIPVGPEVKISALKNAHEYFHSLVLLLEELENETVRYRLIVAKKIPRKDTEEKDGIDDEYYIIASKSYDTYRGGRIAFARTFQGYDTDVKPDWTHFYTPEQGWLSRLTRCHVHPDSFFNPRATTVWPKKKDEEEECTATLKSENSSKPS